MTMEIQLTVSLRAGKHISYFNLNNQQVEYCLGIMTLLGEGVSGHCLICASGMLPPKLRHIWGCLAFSDFFGSKILPYAGQMTF